MSNNKRITLTPAPRGARLVLSLCCRARGKNGRGEKERDAKSEGGAKHDRHDVLGSTSCALYPRNVSFGKQDDFLKLFHMIRLNSRYHSKGNSPAAAMRGSSYTFESIRSK
jgi:hypothetical protein